MRRGYSKAAIWLLIAVLLLGTGAFPGFGAQYDLNKNRYIDVKKTPTGKTGQNASISMVFTNNTSEDLHGVSIMFDSDVANQEYDEELEGEETRSYNAGTFPFEITSSTFDAKIIGTVKKGSSKTVTLSGRVRRDIAEGYYTVPLEVKIGGSHASYEKVNIWITKSSGTTDGSDDDGTLKFVMGENQSTPFGVYPNVMNFSIGIRNASKITAQEVTVKMGLSEDSAKFPFDINDGNYDRTDRKSVV